MYFRKHDMNSNIHPPQNDSSIFSSAQVVKKKRKFNYSQKTQTGEVGEKSRVVGSFEKYTREQRSFFYIE